MKAGHLGEKESVCFEDSSGHARCSTADTFKKSLVFKVESTKIIISYPTSINDGLDVKATVERFCTQEKID